MSAQISARISEETRHQIERFVRGRGISETRLIEDALQHYFAALREIPDNLVVPVRLLLSRDSFEEIIADIESDTPPSEALCELMQCNA